LDTLKKARSHFRFNSNRLDYIGKFLTGEGKIGTSFQLWKDIVLLDCPKAMKKMVAYCKEDVALLERVYKLMQPFITHNTNVAATLGGERYECPNCASGNVGVHRRRFTRMGIMRINMMCRACDSFYTISNKAYMTKVEKELIEKASE